MTGDLVTGGGRRTGLPAAAPAFAQGIAARSSAESDHSVAFAFAVS